MLLSTLVVLIAHQLHLAAGAKSQIMQHVSYSVMKSSLTLKEFKVRSSDSELSKITMAAKDSHALFLQLDGVWDKVYFAGRNSKSSCMKFDKMIATPWDGPKDKKLLRTSVDKKENIKMDRTDMFGYKNKMKEAKCLSLAELETMIKAGQVAIYVGNDYRHANVIQPAKDKKIAASNLKEISLFQISVQPWKYFGGGGKPEVKNALVMRGAVLAVEVDKGPRDNTLIIPPSKTKYQTQKPGPDVVVRSTDNTLVLFNDKLKTWQSCMFDSDLKQAANIKLSCSDKSTQGVKMNYERETKRTLSLKELENECKALRMVMFGTWGDGLSGWAVTDTKISGVATKKGTSAHDSLYEQDYMYDDEEYSYWNDLYNYFVAKWTQY